jgi:hypothetical protein
MRHPRLSLATGTAFVCAIVLAGCGSTSPASQFKSGYAAARGGLNTTFTQINQALRSTPRGSAVATAGTIGVLAARFEKDLAPLEALTPPAGVATAFGTLTTSLGRVERDLRDISVAADRRSFGGAVLAVEKFDSDARAASDAATAIKRKLYTT